jgi:uncharacterized protein (DUF362 family)
MSDENLLPEGVCSRREFLVRAGIAGIGIAGAAALGFGLHNRQPVEESAAVRLPDFRVNLPSDRPKIIAVRGDSVRQMLEQALGPFGGIGVFIKKGDVVVLKPNVGFATPPSVGATTNPELVAAVAALCLSAGAREVRVADNPINDPQRCMRISGIAKAAESAGAKVFYPIPSAFRDIEQPENRILTRWPFFFAPFKNATKVIGLPATKHHSLAVATLGMKNWYGLLGGRRNQLHQDINTSIADLATIVRPTLTILDATRVLFRNGPTGGSPSDVREERTLAVGTDQVAVDTFGASLLGNEPAELPYLAEAERRGLGTTDLKDAGFEMLAGLRMGGFAG